MPDVPEKKSDDGQRIWEARKAGLAQVFGQPSNMELHAVVPFFLGGFADVLAFPEYVPGVTYVTAEMTGEDTGQRPTALGHYELMICARQELPKAGDLISKLARYTCDAELEAGQTMDLGSYFEDTTIRALLFTHPKPEPLHFEFLGQRYGLLLCLGITAQELEFGRSKGTAKLLMLLQQNGVFPYTAPNRASVVVPTKTSLFGRLSGRGENPI